MNANRVALAVATCSLVFARETSAQPALRLTPSVAITQIYDDNMFFGTSDREGDLVTRATPALEMQYDRPLLLLKSHYTFDVERFLDHAALNTMNGRKDAFVEVRSRKMRRVIVGGDANFTTTNMAGELNATTGLGVGRARASRLTVHPTFARELDRNTTATAQYSYARDRVGHVGRLDSHSATFGVERRFSPRRAARFDYSIERFHVGALAPSTSHVAKAGLTANSRTTALDLAGGARVTAGRIAPELAVAIRETRRRTALSLAYTRTQMTVIGFAAAAGTQSLAAVAAYDVHTRVRLRAQPGASWMSTERQQARVYHVALDASTAVSRRLACVATYDIASQDGRFDLATPIAVSRRLFSVSLRVTQQRPTQSTQNF